MDLTLDEFQTHLASDHATPGGGTAAAIALGQAAALTEMVAGLTLGKEKWQSGWGPAETARTVAGQIMVRSGELAQEDSEAFDSVVAGFRMPKSTEEEKDARQQSIRLATLRAAEVPLATSQPWNGFTECPRGFSHSWQCKRRLGCRGCFSSCQCCCQGGSVQCRYQFGIATC